MKKRRRRRRRRRKKKEEEEEEEEEESPRSQIVSVKHSPHKVNDLNRAISLFFCCPVAFSELKHSSFYARKVTKSASVLR